MKHKKLFSIGVLSLALVLSSCRPRGAEYIEDLDMVGTVYTTEIDFSNCKTYAMPNKIVEITSSDAGTTTPTYVSQSNANVVIAQIQQQMKAYGWVLVTDSTAIANKNYDAYLMLSAMESTQIYYTYSMYYYGGYYPYYGWYYPGYYPPSYTTTQTGTLLMQLADMKEKLGDKAPMVWLGVINGMITGTSSSFSSRVATTVNQAFKQSPILKR